jgi:hypothetical protein
MKFNRENLISASRNLKTQDIEAFGGTVTVRELNAAKASTLGKSVTADDKEAMILWFIASVVDSETGTLAFTDEDKAVVGEMAVGEVMKVVKAATALNGFDAESAAKN